VYRQRTKLGLAGLLVLTLVSILSEGALADAFGPVTLGITNAPQGVGKYTNIATVSGNTIDPTQFQFTVTALPGYSIQVQSNDFFNFNTNIVPLSDLSLHGGVVTVFSTINGTTGSTTVKANVNTDVVGQSGTGEFDLGLNDSGNPPKINIGGTTYTVTGASQIQFIIDLANGANYSSLMASNFYPQPNSEGWNFEMHFCDGSGPNCGQPTGFVVDTGTPTPVPEPGSLALLATGVTALPAIFYFRRRSVLGAERSAFKNPW